MSHDPERADVAVVGFGPVGQLAALLLGRLGVRVVVLERSAEPFGVPRAAAVDDAVLRIFARAGLDVPVHVPASVAMITAGGRVLPILDPARGPGGGVPALASFDQVALEGVLREAASAVADVRSGSGVASVERRADEVVLGLEDGSAVRASWVLACDGARSTVRRALGIGFRGSTYARPWLVVDAAVEMPVAGVDGIRFVADPRRPAVTLALAPGLHRWEFMLDAPASGAAAPTTVPDWRELVRPWADPAALRPRRVAVYTYHARVAERWRDGRVLLAGDAAHVMPPFAGQGLSAGLRDVDTLCWKLAAVVTGAADPSLLDTYERERRPEVVRFSALARFMGAVLQTRRARGAAARDAAFSALSAAPVLGPWFAAGGVRPQSVLGPGLVVRGRGAGRLVAPELDGALPAGWAVVGRRPDPAWVRAGVPFVDVADHPETARRLRRARADVLAVRPDRYVYAAARTGALAPPPPYLP